MPDSVFDKVDASKSTAAQPTPASASTEPQPVRAEETAEYWKTRFDGANRKINELVQGTRTKEETLAQYAQKLSDAENAIKNHESRYTGLEQNLKEATDKLTAAETKAATVEKQLGRITVVASEFPHLSTYQARNLLRTDIDNTDDYRKYLADFDAALKGVQKQAVAKEMEGVLPSSVPQSGSQTVDKDVLWQRMDDLIAKGDFKGAEALEVQYANASKASRG